MSSFTIPSINPSQSTPVLPNMRRSVMRPSGASCSCRNSRQNRRWQPSSILSGCDPTRDGTTGPTAAGVWHQIPIFIVSESRASRNHVQWVTVACLRLFNSRAWHTLHMISNPWSARYFDFEYFDSSLSDFDTLMMTAGFLDAAAGEHRARCRDERPIAATPETRFLPSHGAAISGATEVG